jgi:hypothetical protein
MNLRPALYRAAQIMGDAIAIMHGPRAIGARIQRRALGRWAHRAIMRLVPPRRRTR